MQVQVQSEPADNIQSGSKSSFVYSKIEELNEEIETFQTRNLVIEQRKHELLDEQTKMPQDFEEFQSKNKHELSKLEEQKFENIKKIKEDESQLHANLSQVFENTRLQKKQQIEHLTQQIQNSKKIYRQIQYENKQTTKQLHQELFEIQQLNIKLKKDL